MDSVHDKLSRVRKPRVHITYDVETEGASVKKELPFVVGVMGDFSANPTKELKPLKERKFVQIDRDNFDGVMKKMSPGLQLKVDNTLKDDDSKMSVELQFNSFDDFEPGKLINQIEPLKKLLESRNKLRDILTKADRSEDLESILETVLQNTEELTKLSGDLGIDPESLNADDSDPDKAEDDSEKPEGDKE